MPHRFARFISSFNNGILIFFLTICIVTFAYISGETAVPAVNLPPAFLSAFPGDFPRYIWRFACSFVLLGVFPLAAAFLLGKKPAELGLVKPRPLFSRGWIRAVLGGGIVVFAFMNAYSPGLYAYYPYAESLVSAVGKRGALPLLLHSAAYTLFFYVPWEITFRGLLILPFIYAMTGDPKTPSRFPEKWETSPVLLAVAFIQIVPSALLHFGHPYIESLGSVAFGVLTAIVVLRTRSILWPVIFHAASGICMDMFIILRKLEVLP